MKEGYYEKLSQIAQRMSTWASRQENILERLNNEVKELRTPESKKLAEAEKEQLYTNSLAEDHE